MILNNAQVHIIIQYRNINDRIMIYDHNRSNEATVKYCFLYAFDNLF